MINAKKIAIRAFAAWKSSNIAIAVSLLLFAVLPASFVIAQTFSGPNCAAGQCNGAIGLDSNSNLSIGTSTPQSDTKLLIVGTSTGTSYFAIKAVDKQNGPLLLVRSDGSVTIGSNQFAGGGTVAPGVGSQSSASGGLFVHGPIVSDASISSTAISGNFTGMVPAANVTTGVFGSCGSCSGGNYAFSASLGVGTSSQAGLPQALSVYGNGYFSGYLSVGTTTGPVSGGKIYVQNEVGAHSAELTLDGTAGGIGGAYDIETDVNNSDLNITHHVPSGDLNLVSIDTSGNVGIATQTMTSRFNVNGSAYISGNLTCGGTCGGSSQWTTSGSNIYYTGGNVGVGTNNPAQALTVSGGVEGDATSTAANAYNEFIGGLYPANYSNFSNREFRIQTQNNGSSYNTYLLFNGHASGSLSSPTFTQGNYGRFLGIEYNQNQINFMVNTSTAGSGSNSTITPTRALTVDYTGRIGIGTTNPTSTLEIAGTAHIYTPCSGFCSSTTNYNGVYISTNGQIGIATTAPAAPLDIEGNGSGMSDAILQSDGTSPWYTIAGIGCTNGGSGICWKNSSGFRMRLSNTGGLVLAGTLTQSGAPDVAENIPAADATVGAGDIVVPDPAYQAAAGASIYDHAAVEKASAPYARNILGVISTDPGILLNSKDITTGVRVGDSERPLTLVGRTPVKVSTENGPVMTGDLITSSDMPGFGMKETKAGMVVGTALESFDGIGTGSTACGAYRCGEILVLVNPHWMGE